MWDENSRQTEIGELRPFAKMSGEKWHDLFYENHPFVQRTLKEMPQFSPVFMFRLCEMKCHERSRNKSSPGQNK